MLDAEEREGSSRGRLDLLLEQLGPNVVSETLEVETWGVGPVPIGGGAVGGWGVGAHERAGPSDGDDGDVVG